MNKNVFQVILAIAIIILFILHFSSGKKAVVKEESASSVAELVDSPIAFVNMDTLIAKLDMWTDMQNALSEQQTKYDNELSNLQKNFQNKVNDLNNKVQKMLITQADAQTQAERLSAEEQDLYSRADEYQQRLAEQLAVNSNQVIDALNTFLKEFNADGRYQYILANANNQILFADEAFDLTQQVVDGMNAQYKSSK